MRANIEKVLAAQTPALVTQRANLAYLTKQRMLDTRPWVLWLRNVARDLQLAVTMSAIEALAVELHTAVYH